MHNWFYQWINNNKEKVLASPTIRFLKVQQFPHHPTPFTSVLVISNEFAGRFLVYKNNKIYEEVVGQIGSDLLIGRSTYVEGKEDILAIFTFYLLHSFDINSPLMN
ncbi:hypothetical protein CN918_31555 [Priestia megaterium]|nr:hypothetical protein CN918_31555 [Priestia megaterium]